MRWPKFIYFIRRADTGLIKIGCSSWPEERRLCFAGKFKADMTTLAQAPAPGGFWDEREIHRRFASDRVEGEWFSPSDALLGFIEEVRRAGGVPIETGEGREQVIYRRRKAGETLQSIANDYAITRERVRQIVSEIDHGRSPRQRAA